MRLPNESESALPRKGWIPYDGGCGFCFRWVHLWERVVERRGFTIKDLQSAHADGSLQVSHENLLDDIRVFTRAGKLESGADAYLYVSRTCRGAYGGHGLFMQSSACRFLTGCFGWVIAGLIEIDIESLAIVPYPGRLTFVASRKTSS